MRFLGAGALCFCLSLAALAQQATTPDTLVYADFENSAAGHVLSSRGGAVQTIGWQEKEGMAATVDPVFLESDGSSSKRMAFNYKLLAPQKYTGAALKIDGLPNKDGKPQAEDLSGYKEISFQMEAAGPRHVRVMLLSEKTNLTVAPGCEPAFVVEVKPGFETYHIPLKKFDTPAYAPPNNASTKAVLREVTGVQIATDEQGSSGHVILDKIEFLK